MADQRPSTRARSEQLPRAAASSRTTIAAVAEGAAATHAHRPKRAADLELEKYRCRGERLSVIEEMSAKAYMRDRAGARVRGTEAGARRAARQARGGLRAIDDERGAGLGDGGGGADAAGPPDVARRGETERFPRFSGSSGVDGDDGDVGDDAGANARTSPPSAKTP